MLKRFFGKKEVKAQQPKVAAKPNIVVVVRQRGKLAQRTSTETSIIEALIGRGWQVNQITPAQQDEVYGSDFKSLRADPIVVIGTEWKDGYYEDNEPTESDPRTEKQVLEVHMDARIIRKDGVIIGAKHLVVQEEHWHDYEKLWEETTNFIEKTLSSERS